MILLSEQMRIVNRLTPIKFSEDEFRLTEQLTHNRIFNRLDSLEDDVLLDTYYNIRLNYFDQCSTEENKYLYLLYTILIEVLTVRKVDYNGYVTKRKLKILRINSIAIAIGVIPFLIFMNNLYVCLAFIALNAFIVYRWKTIIAKVAKKFKTKIFKIQEFKMIFASLFLGDLLLTIFAIRAYNSVVYLFLGNLFVIFLWRYIMKKSKGEKALKFEEKWKQIVLQCVEYGVMLFLLANTVRPLLDVCGMFLRTSNYLYLEGICMDVKDLPFGFKRGKVNNVEVVLADRNNLEVGNLYRIVYGDYTKAVISVKQITVKTNTEETEEINKQIDELIEDSKREEAKKIEENLEKEQKK